MHDLIFLILGKIMSSPNPVSSNSPKNSPDLKRKEPEKAIDTQVQRVVKKRKVDLTILEKNLWQDIKKRVKILISNSPGNFDPKLFQSLLQAKPRLAWKMAKKAKKNFSSISAITAYAKRAYVDDENFYGATVPLTKSLHRYQKIREKSEKLHALDKLSSRLAFPSASLRLLYKIHPPLGLNWANTYLTDEKDRMHANYLHLQSLCRIYTRYIEKNELVSLELHFKKNLCEEFPDVEFKDILRKKIFEILESLKDLEGRCGSSFNAYRSMGQIEIMWVYLQMGEIAEAEKMMQEIPHNYWVVDAILNYINDKYRENPCENLEECFTVFKKIFLKIDSLHNPREKFQQFWTAWRTFDEIITADDDSTEAKKKHKDFPEFISFFWNLVQKNHALLSDFSFLRDKYAVEGMRNYANNPVAEIIAYYFVPYISDVADSRRIKDLLLLCAGTDLLEIVKSIKQIETKIDEELIEEIIKIGNSSDDFLRAKAKLFFSFLKERDNKKENRSLQSLFALPLCQVKFDILHQYKRFGDVFLFDHEENLQHLNNLFDQMFLENEMKDVDPIQKANIFIDHADWLLSNKASEAMGKGEKLIAETQKNLESLNSSIDKDQILFKIAVLHMNFFEKEKAFATIAKIDNLTTRIRVLNLLR